MKRRILCLVTVLMLLAPCAALAARQYIITDSGSRKLTEDELWQWDYESLGFILNEIFARHGYNFDPGGQYDQYFSQRPWYAPNADPNNSRACYPKMNSVEWYNEHLVKEVRAQMRAQGTKNKGGMNFRRYIESTVETLSGFRSVNVKGGQRFPVYSAPSENSLRGANGKAVISTNGAMYAAGWENGWLFIMYQTNKGAIRAGWVWPSGLSGETLPQLRFAYVTGTCTRSATLTDDPVTLSTSLAQLYQGDVVTYLTTFQNSKGVWAYVETMAGGKVARGFIPYDALDIGAFGTENEDEDLNG